MTIIDLAAKMELLARLGIGCGMGCGCVIPFADSLTEGQAALLKTFADSLTEEQVGMIPRSGQRGFRRTGQGPAVFESILISTLGGYDPFRKGGHRDQMMQGLDGGFGRSGEDSLFPASLLDDDDDGDGGL